jgi:hypothetical protein
VAEAVVKLLLDLHRDPLGRGQGVGPAMGLGFLQQQGFELAQLLVGQAGGSAWISLGCECLRDFATKPPPTIYGEATNDDKSFEHGGSFAAN